MGLVISGTVWHVTWQHFRGDLWLLLQLTYTSPFPQARPFLSWIGLQSGRVRLGLFQGAHGGEVGQSETPPKCQRGV